MKKNTETCRTLESTVVLKRMVAVTQFLAKKIFYFWGKNEALGCNSLKNGNFLGFIELLGKFDSVTKKHFENVKSKNTDIRYLSSDI